MLEDLTTEASNPASKDLDLLSTLEFVQLMNAEDAKITLALSDVADRVASAIDIIVASLKQKGRLIYIGAGTSGRLGVLDAVECVPTFNTTQDQVVGVMAGGDKGLVQAVEGAEDSSRQGQLDLEALSLTAKDCVVGITASGRTPYVLGALQYAREVEAKTIGVCCNQNSELESVSDVIIAPVVGPEVLSGSTRMKAGTATKMVLNMLSTGAMVQMGKTYGNYMVDVQATNSKLEHRATRMLVNLTGLSRELAGKLLEDCNGEVKTAVVSKQLGLPPAKARKRLVEHDGHLRKALSQEASD